jgi:outer membrane protein assembly factor BamB
MQRRQLLGGLVATSLAGCLRLTEGGSTDQSSPSGTTTPRLGRRTPEGGASLPDVSDSWSQYGSDARNTGFVPGSAGPTGGVSEGFRWVTGRATASSPVVADGRVYFTTNGTSELIALDAVTGERGWSVAVDGLFEYAPAYAEGTLFVGTMGGTVYGIDAETGEFSWEQEIADGTFGPPVVRGDVLYLCDFSGGVYALSTNDGSTRWETSVDGVVLGGAAVADGTVYVPSVRPTDIDRYPDDVTNQDFFVAEPDDAQIQQLFEMDDAAGSLDALSASDGSRQWDVDLPDFAVSTPAVVDGTVYVGCWDGNLYALNAAGGTERWAYDAGAPISASPSVADGTAYVGTWDGTVTAVGTDDGTREWFRPVPDGDIVTSKPCVTDGLVYVAVNDGPVLAIDMDGKLDWTFSGPANDFDYSSPAVVDGVVYVCGATGRRTVDGEEIDTGGLFALV